MKDNDKKDGHYMKAKLKAWAYNWRFIMLSFGTSLGIMLLIAFCYDMFPFGDITILRMDLYHQYGPLLAELYDRLVHGQSLVYSWQFGGGGSFLGNFFNYLSSPLSFVVLLFGHKNTTDAIAFIITLKAALSAATLTYYFKESNEYKTSSFLTAGFGVLYAFSGYFIAYYWNFMWLDGMMLLPIIILGLEKLIDEGRGLLYCLSLALLMFSTYYMAYMVCIFCVFYAICYYAGKHKFGKKLAVSIGKFAGYSVLAGGLSAFSLLPTFYCLRTCSATSDSFPTEISTYFDVFDFLCQHLAALEPTIRSSGEDVLPNIFCGIITVILALIYLYTKSIPLKEKVSRFALLLFLFLSMNINYLNNIWHAFHFPNDLPYRFSYCYSFVLITLAVKAILKLHEIDSKTILTIGLGVSAFIVLAEEITSKNVKTETVIISLAFAIVYTIALKVLKDHKAQSFAMSILIFCLMFAEVAIANTDNYDIDQPKKNYASDYPDFKVLKSKLDSREKDKFYRMELTDLRTRMDNSWYGYNGLSVFSSMAYERSANLHSNLGMFSNYINSYTYNPQTPVYNAMFSLKYVVNNSTAIDMPSNFYKKVATVDKFDAYENLYCLPLGFTVPSSIDAWNTIDANPFNVQNSFWSIATGNQDVFEKIPINDCLYYNIDNFGEDEIESGNLVFYTQNEGQNSSFTLKLIPEKTQNIYVYVESSNVDTITIRSEDDSFLKSQTIDEPYIFDLGKHKAGEVLYLDVPITEGSSGFVDCYIYGLNEEAFKTGFEALQNKGMEITSMSDTKLSGTVTAKNSCTLYTSINYDDSWDVYIDGVKASEEQIVSIGGALLGVRLDSGTHNIEFKYHAQGLSIGLLISFASLVILIATILIPKFFKKEEKEALV